MRDTRREGAVGRNIGSAAFVSRHVRWVRGGASRRFRRFGFRRTSVRPEILQVGERQESCAKISA